MSTGLEILNAAGSRIWVRSIGSAVRDADGTILRVHGGFQEIGVLGPDAVETHEVRVVDPLEEH